MTTTNALRASLIGAAATLALAAPAGAATAGTHADALVRPKHVTVDRSLPPARLELAILRARQLYTFWNTGSATWLRRATVSSFVDHTPPPGRKQGRAGVLAASKAFRAAIPDLTCELADLTVSGDRVTARQVYRGHFSGVYDGVQGTGQPIRFNAIDIQQMGRRKIVGDWHLEDTAALETQLGVR